MSAERDAVSDNDFLGQDVEADRPPLAKAAVAAQRHKVDQLRLGGDQPVAIIATGQFKHADVIAGPGKPTETGGFDHRSVVI